MKPIKIQRGLKKIFWGILLCFISPVIVMQAFKNEGHPFYWPVLIIGLLFFIAAIGLGFWGIGRLVTALLGKKRKG